MLVYTRTCSSIHGPTRASRTPWLENRTVSGQAAAPVAHRDDRAFLAVASGQAPVPLAEEGVGARQRGDDLAEGCGQPGVAAAGGAAFLGAGGLVVDGGELRPGDQVRGGGKAAHLDADLGDQLLGGD